MYRIISFDGGGIRGLLSVRLLERLERERPGFLDEAHMYAGTSIGGIIALGLASGFPVGSVGSLFFEVGRRTFSRQGYAGRLRSSNLTGPKYSAGPLEEELTKLFGGKRLADLPKGVMVTSFNVDNKGDKGRPRSWSPKIFHNLDEDTGDLSALCSDVALCTSAAPTYLPSHGGFIDGGVAANNPSMCAYALARNLMRHKGLPEEEIALLSIGTGESNRYIEDDTRTWGVLDWSKVIMPLLMDAPAKVTDYQCRAILADSYFRMNPVLPGKGLIALDDVRSIEILLHAADEYDLSGATRWIDNCWSA